MVLNSAIRSSNRCRLFSVFAIVILVSSFCVGVTAQEEQNTADNPPPVVNPESVKESPSQPVPALRKVKRAARPEFPDESSSDLFFNDVFSEALVGARPEATGQAAPIVAASSPDSSDAGHSPSAGSAWSTIISASVLEDEIKRQQIRLNGLVTNPGQFKTRNFEIGETFQMLAMTFAIVSQYDENVRWKDQSISVTAALIDSAKQARGTDLAAFENAKRTTQRLGDLVRGGNFGDEVNAAVIEDWSSVVDRTALMNRLDEIVTGPLKTATSSKDEFSSETESIMHEAAIVAAIGRVLQLPEMDDADDEDYSALAIDMVESARILSSAAIDNDFDAAAVGLNKISQSCVRCHADWR